MAAEDSRPEAETHPAAVVADNQAEADRWHRTAAEPDSLASVAGSYRPGLVAVGGSIPAVDKAECWAGRDTLHMDCIHLSQAIQINNSFMKIFTNNVADPVEVQVRFQVQGHRIHL